MKILAQSTVVPKPSYIHMGYVASSHIKGEAATLFSGLFMIGIGLMLCCRICLTKEFLGTIALKPLQISAWKWVVTGFMLIITGVFLVFLSEKFGERVYASPRQAVPSIMYNIVSSYNYKYQPKKMSFKDYLEKKPRHKNDSWGSEIKIKIISETPDLVVQMDSAGPDKNFGSLDDIVREYTLKADDSINTREIYPPQTIETSKSL